MSNYLGPVDEWWDKRQKAHRIVHNAIKDGALNKPSICSKCGCSGEIQGHHDDYDKPLEML
jgi:hypothetical protein